ncbi:hypothetical protein C8R47DRAFT_1242432 [Mycena vitilis]|nr:hypothetical protein C8R47DRAFT_1329610 [Mycena vitilis]KAJ6460676.1 hypothetical protein C8R47DRAFT_1242432 [Mycena vitilis]
MLGPLRTRRKFLPASAFPPGLPDVSSAIIPSPAIAMKLATLSDVPYGSQWADFLFEFDIFPLFQLSLHSLAVFNKVMEHVRKYGGDSCHTDELAACGPYDFLGTVPVDIFFFILRQLPLLDRYNLGRSSRKYYALHLREFQASVNVFLREFGLCHSEIRFMQSALWVVISGSAITRLVLSAGTPDNIDFHTPRDAYPWLVRFMELTTSYQFRPDAGPIRHFQGTLDRMVWVCRPTQRTLKFICSNSGNPMDCGPDFPFSHGIAMLTHFGLWIGHAKTATKGLTMPSRSRVPTNYPDLSDMVDKYIRHGYTLIAERSGPHTCGVDYECPATIRTSIDGGCMNLFFPNLPYLAAPQQTVCHSQPISWHLEGSVCEDGLQCRPVHGVVIKRPLNIMYLAWRNSFDNMVAHAVSVAHLRAASHHWRAL